MAGRGSEGWDRAVDDGDGVEVAGNATTCAAGCCAAAWDGGDTDTACEVEPGVSCPGTRGARAGGARTSGAGCPGSMTLGTPTADDGPVGTCTARPTARTPAATAASGRNAAARCRKSRGTSRILVLARRRRVPALGGRTPLKGGHGRTRSCLETGPSAVGSPYAVAIYSLQQTGTRPTQRFFATSNMAVERSACLASDGFDEPFSGPADDRDFCDRWRHGGRLVYQPGAIVVHAHHPDLPRLRPPAPRLRQWRGHLPPAAGTPGLGRIRDDLGFPVDLARRVATGAQHVTPGTALRGASRAGLTPQHGACLTEIGRSRTVAA